MSNRFLRPLIGITSALAIAAAAVFVGIQFAAARQFATESAPILAPISVDGASNSAAPGDGRFSPAVGEGTIVTPGQDGATPIGEVVLSTRQLAWRRFKRHNSVVF